VDPATRSLDPKKGRGKKRKRKIATCRERFVARNRPVRARFCLTSLSGADAYHPGGKGRGGKGKKKKRKKKLGDAGVPGVHTKRPTSEGEKEQRRKKGKKKEKEESMSARHQRDVWQDVPPTAFKQMRRGGKGKGGKEGGVDPTATTCTLLSLL